MGVDSHLVGLSHISPVGFYNTAGESPLGTRVVRDVLRTIANKNSKSEFLCRHAVEELTALCPQTCIPDYYRLVVEYFPGASLVELKSLKLYCDTFRQREIYHEELLNEFFREFETVVRPRWLLLTLEVNIRGGIRTIVTRESGTGPPGRVPRPKGRSAK